MENTGREKVQLWRYEFSFVNAEYKVPMRTPQKTGLVEITGSVGPEFREERVRLLIQILLTTQVAAVMSTQGPDYMKLFPNLI